MAGEAADAAPTARARNSRTAQVAGAGPAAAATASALQAKTAAGTAARVEARRPGDGTGAPLQARRSLPGWAVAAVPALAELLIGGYRISVPSLWRDEAATIAGSQRPAGAILAMLANQDVVHGPYYLLMHLVIATGGTSAAVLRLPSLIAMCLTAAATALLGRRLARAADLPAPAATGLLAGLLLAVLPLTTRYAQEARPYALTSLFAVLASYALVRAAQQRGLTWWAGYAAAVALAGMFSLFALLILAAHGASLLAARPAGPGGRRGYPGTQARDGGLAPRVLARWLAACAAAVIVLSPMLILGGQQRSQLDWVTRPGLASLASLAAGFAGRALLIPAVVILAAAGATAGRGIRRGSGLSMAVVALPWLVLPPALLFAASLLRPVYVERYVLFCLPAVSLLSAAGLIRLIRLATASPAGQNRARAVALAAAAAALIGIALAAPQQSVRLTSARPDNLRAVGAVIAASERPGDAVVYLPWAASLAGVAYPGPFRTLRDAELGVSPAASATLRGLPVPAAALPARLAGSDRVWTVRYAGQSQAGWSRTDRAAAALVSRMRLVARWRVGSIELSLYSQR